MTKFVLSRPGAPWDYPTLGFTADADGAILDGTLFDPDLTIPPDAHWSVYGGGSAETNITRYATPAEEFLDPTPETTDGWLLAYDTAENRATFQDPADLIETGAWADTLNASYVAMAKKPTGVAATDYANIMAAHTALPAGGGRIMLHPGTYNLGSNLLAFTKTVTLVGAGGRFVATNQGGTFPGSALTTITCSSANGKALSLSETGCTITDLAVVNSSPLGVTSGSCGIYMEDGHNFSMQRVTVQGFYDCVRVEGRFGAMTDCHIYDPVRYGLLMTNDNSGEYDFGDQGIVNCVFAMYGRQIGGGFTEAEAAVRWESAGGIRWGDNKIVAGTGPGASNIAPFKYGIDIQVADGVSTVEFMIAGGGISTCSVACIRIGQKGPSYTGTMNDIIVSGVVLQGYGSSAVGITAGANTPALINNIKSLVVTGCTFKGVLGGGVRVTNVRSFYMGTCTWDTFASYTEALVWVGNSDGTGPQGVVIDQQNIGRADSLTVVKDTRKRANAGSPSLNGQATYEYTRHVYSNSTTWVDLFTFEPPDEGGAGIIELTLSGHDFGVTRFAKKLRRSFLKNNGTVGGAVTIATLGTDENIGTTTYVETQVVDAGSGKVKIQARMATGGTTVWGRATVKVTGDVQKFSLGAGI